ncbi:MAG: nucleotidyltransferase domain-containing protein, partial [Chloroflexi bacterium]
DSDIDFILLTPSPDSFRHATTWPYEIAWLQAGLRLVKWHDRTYGAVWSRHLLFDTGLQVEMSFGALSWASVTPLDSGTRRVIADGCRILYDPEQLLATLLHVIHPNE